MSIPEPKGFLFIVYTRIMFTQNTISTYPSSRYQCTWLTDRQHLYHYYTPMVCKQVMAQPQHALLKITCYNLVVEILVFQKYRSFVLCFSILWVFYMTTNVHKLFIPFVCVFYLYLFLSIFVSWWLVQCIRIMIIYSVSYIKLKWKTKLHSSIVSQTFCVMPTNI